MKIYINGSFYDESEAKISVLDHGLLYGDGVFEGIRFYDRCLFCLEEHIDRLYRSAQAICLNVPLTKQEISDAINASIQANYLDNGYIRLIVTRGVGKLGLNPIGCLPTVIIITSMISLYPKENYEHGLKIITCSTRRNTHDSLSPSIKSLNYLTNILGKIEALNANVEEAIMLNQQGFITECTGDNIFLVKNNILLTPPISSGILPGITRATVIKLASKHKIPIQENNLTCYDVYTADECFLTGTAAEIVPVIEVDQRKIGCGKPGSLTQLIMKYFLEYTQQKIANIF